MLNQFFVALEMEWNVQDTRLALASYHGQRCYLCKGEYQEDYGIVSTLLDLSSVKEAA